YRLRTYGPEGRSVCPDAETLRAAVRRAKETRILGRAAIAAHHALRENAPRRVREALGVRIRDPYAKKKQSPRAEREAQLIAMLQELGGEQGGFSLEDVCDNGQLAACAEWVRRERTKASRPVEVLFDEISDRLNLAIDFANELQAGDPDYDDADAFER